MADEHNQTSRLILHGGTFMPNNNIMKVSQIELDSSFFSSLKDEYAEESLAGNLLFLHKEWQRIKDLIIKPTFQFPEEAVAREFQRGLTYNINSEIATKDQKTLLLSQIRDYVKKFSDNPNVQNSILFIICQRMVDAQSGDAKPITFGAEFSLGGTICGFLLDMVSEGIVRLKNVDKPPITIKRIQNQIVFSNSYLYEYTVSYKNSNDKMLDKTIDNFAKLSFECSLDATTYELALSKCVIDFPEGVELDVKKLSQDNNAHVTPINSIRDVGFQLKVTPAEIIRKQLSSELDQPSFFISNLKRAIELDDAELIQKYIQKYIDNILLDLKKQNNPDPIDLKKQNNLDPNSLALIFSYIRGDNVITFWEDNNIVPTKVDLLSTCVDVAKTILTKEQFAEVTEEIKQQLEAELQVSIRRLWSTRAEEDALHLQNLVELCNKHEFSLMASSTANCIAAVVKNDASSEFIMQQLSQALQNAKLEVAGPKSTQQELFSWLEQLLNNSNLAMVKKYLIIAALLQNVKDSQNNSGVIRLIGLVIKKENDILSFLMEPAVSFGSKIALLSFWKQKNSPLNNFATQLTNYFKLQFVDFGKLKKSSGDVVKSQQLTAVFIEAAKFAEIDGINPAGNFCAAFKAYLSDERYSVSQKLNLLASIQSMRTQFPKSVQDQLNKAIQEYLTETAKSLAKMVAAKDTFFARFSKKAQASLKTAEQQLGRLVTIAFKNNDRATVSEIQQYIRESKLSAAARLKIMAAMKVLEENSTDFSVKVADLFKPAKAIGNSRLARMQHWMKYVFSPSYRALCKEIEVMSKAAITAAMSHADNMSVSATTTEVTTVPVPANDNTVRSSSTPSTLKIKLGVNSLSSLPITGSLDKDKTETIMVNPATPTSTTSAQSGFDNDSRPVSPDSTNSRNSFISANSMPPVTFFISFPTNKNKDAKQADTPTSQQSGSNTPSLTTATNNKPRSHSDPIPVSRSQSIGVK